MQQPEDGDKERPEQPDAGDAAGSPEAAPEGPATEAGGRADPAWRRNFAMRLATGLPTLAAVLALVVLAPPVAVAALVALAGLGGTYEFVCLVTGCEASEGGEDAREAPGMTAAVLRRTPLLAAAAAVGIGGMVGTPAALNAGLLVGVLIVGWSVWFAAPSDGRDALRDLGVGLAGLLLVPWLLGHVSLTAYLPGGPGFLAFLLLVATFNDTAAYLVGRFLGRHLLAPTVSPKKTVEGSVGGLLGGVAAGAVASLWLGGAPTALGLPALLGLGALLAAAGQAGDLLESKLKRLTRAGDSGNFLPGHGGLLDRLDVFLLSAPLSYHLLALLQP